jgi:hypothetical protein
MSGTGILEAPQSVTDATRVPIGHRAIPVTAAERRERLELLVDAFNAWREMPHETRFEPGEFGRVVIRPPISLFRSYSPHRGPATLPEVAGHESIRLHAEFCVRCYSTLEHEVVFTDLAHVNVAGKLPLCYGCVDSRTKALVDRWGDCGSYGADYSWSRRYNATTCHCGRLVRFAGSRVRRFCSQRCSQRAAADRAKKRRMHARRRDCEVCGNEFTPLRSDAKFCSGACRQFAYRSRSAS